MTRRIVGNRYELHEELGAGAFGRVWKAWDPALGIGVAVKEVFLAGLSEAEHAQRLVRAEREARNAARLRDHPNVVSVHDVVLEDGRPWIVMDLVDGRSLAEAISVLGPLPTESVARLARGLLAALGAAHGMEIVHRDVKPQNVMLTDDGRALLMDFGIAVHTADTVMTASHGVIGTLEYMAPERFNGQGTDAVADLYSLGVTLFQAAEGFSPFHRDTPTETLAAVVLEAAPQPTRAGPLTELITRLMSKDPAQRPTVEQALAMLDQASAPVAPAVDAPTMDAPAGRHDASFPRLPPPPVRPPVVGLGPAAGGPPAAGPARQRGKIALAVGAVTVAVAVIVATVIALTPDDGAKDAAGSGPGTSAGDATSGAIPGSGGSGDLANPCGRGDPTKSPAQGVTADEIQVGVMTDAGFTKNTEFADAAKVFTSWCNDAGGINGRKVTVNLRDTKMMEVRQRMVEACREDFMLVGGGAAMDGLGVKDRLSCLLPEFPAQVGPSDNLGADLQVSVQPGGRSYATSAGYFSWLVNEAYPASKGAVGILNGDSPMVKVSGQQTTEVLRGLGTTMVYDELYPLAGVADWTPYAQALKQRNVRGLVFLGAAAQLAKLEQALTAVGHKLDWIDVGSAYAPNFIDLAGDQTLRTQNTLADLSGIIPAENAAANPATRQLVDLYAKYAPGAKITLPAVKAFSAWLLFAESAADCGDDLTRKCAYDAAMKEKSWTGGGLQAPVDLSDKDRRVMCFNVMQATADGWKAADFHADANGYRCDAATYKYTGVYGKPMTLADIGKSQADFR